jgi:hypothetical protein
VDKKGNLQMSERGLNRLFFALFLGCVIAMISGCASPSGQTPQRSWYKPWTWLTDKSQEEKTTAREVAKVESALNTNSLALIRGAALKVAATGEALRQATNRDAATDLASTFNSQAANLLPEKPSLSELADLKAIVAGLLSTNLAERVNAAARLDAKDKQLAELQRMTGELKAKLETAEQSHAAAVAKLTDAYVGERAVADKWRQEQAKTWLTRIGDLLGTGGMVALAATGVLSVPMAGRIFGYFSRVMPSSSVLTGVVSAKGFDNVVAGVESVRKALRNNVGDAELSERVDDLLRIERGPDDKKLINARRQRLRKSAA